MYPEAPLNRPDEFSLVFPRKCQAFKDWRGNIISCALSNYKSKKKKKMAVSFSH